MEKFGPTSFLYKGEKTHYPSLLLRSAIVLLGVMQLLHSKRQGKKEWGSCQSQLSDNVYVN